MPGSERTRVLVIGAGPAGMSALYHYRQLADDNKPEVVCYEKQSDFGGLWNYSWRTGTEEHGELAPWGMYHDLWINAPKECMEYPDYTFEKHYGRTLPSYIPRAVMRDYLKGRWVSKDLRKFIKFNTIVKRVVYNASTDDFSVWSKDLAADVDGQEERFDYVIVAVGIFNTPNVPSIPGLGQFTGRILHSHDFRDAKEFEGKRVLLLGSSYSAEDLALLCRKYGSGHVICSWRNTPMGFKWPKGIEERPFVQKMEGNTAFFKDGSSAEVDVVIFCTGYLFNFPFLSDELRLKCRISFYPDGLYKGIVFLGGGNNKLLYLGTIDQFFSFTMFDVQASWAWKYITGTIQLPRKEDMLKDVAKWRHELTLLKDHFDQIEFQSAYVAELCTATGYTKEIVKAADLYRQWEKHKLDNLATYRDNVYFSIYTGNLSIAPKTPFMEAFDDSLETFINQ